MYVIEFTDEVLNEQLPKIPKTMRQRILKAIQERLTVAPLDYRKSLRYSLKHHRRLRVGDYRIIYRVYEEKILVLFVEIDHRKDVYED